MSNPGSIDIDNMLSQLRDLLDIPSLKLSQSAIWGSTSVNLSLIDSEDLEKVMRRNADLAQLEKEDTELRRHFMGDDEFYKLQNK